MWQNTALQAQLVSQQNIAQGLAVLPGAITTVLSRSFFFGRKEGTVNQSVQKSQHAIMEPGRRACGHPQPPMEGVWPSEPCAQRRPRSDVATAFAAAHDSMAPQRMRHACSARFCKTAVSCRALALANCDTNDLVSADQRPPTSMASTTNLARDRGPHQFGVRAFLPSPCNLQHHPICIRSCTMR